MASASGELVKTVDVEMTTETETETTSGEKYQGGDEYAQEDGGGRKQPLDDARQLNDVRIRWPNHPLDCGGWCSPR